jgi:Zn-dependent peptidase ImmA (M78 family)
MTPVPTAVRLDATHGVSASPIRHIDVQRVELLAKLLESLSSGERPGFLWGLCRELGVRTVTYSPSLQGLDGRTEWRDDGPHIQLSTERSLWERPPVLAHELTHVLLARHDLYGAALGRRLDTGGAMEEAVCNWVAAALLVPASGLPAAGSPLMPSVLVALARNRRVPIAVVLRRARLLGHSPTFVRFERLQQRWAVSRVDGPDWHAAWTLVERSQALLSALARCDQTDRKATVALGTPDGDTSVRLDVVAGHTGRVVYALTR